MSKRTEYTADVLLRRQSGNASYSEADIDRIIEAMGGLPDRLFDDAQASPDGSGIVTTEIDARTALTRQLEELAALWAHEILESRRPSPKEMAATYAGIEHAAAYLLKALGLSTTEQPSALSDHIRRGLHGEAIREADQIGGFPELPPIRFAVQGHEALDYRAPEKVRQVVEGIVQLRGWAVEAKDRATRKITPKLADNEGDKALDSLFRGYIALWLEFFGEMPGTSYNVISNNAGGPFVRFVDTALAPLLGNAAPTPNAIRDRTRRLLRRKGTSRKRKE